MVLSAGVLSSDPTHTCMSAPRFIFVSDQGRVFSSHDEPTTDDFAYAVVGMVTIIRLADFHSYGSKQGWFPIPAGELTRANIENDSSPPFHAAPPEHERGPRAKARRGRCE